LSAAVLFASVAPAVAADPAVEVRIQSIDALLTNAEYLGGLLRQGEQVKQFVGLAKAFTNAKTGLEGIDPAKDFGLYATVTPNVEDSPVVLMIPIKDNDAFLNLFTNRLQITPKKQDDGVYTLEVPMLPRPVNFRFAHGYAYATIGDAKNVAAAGLLAPDTFFATKSTAVLSATVHVERVPEEIRKVFFGQIELKIAEEKGKKNPNEQPAERMAKELILDGVVMGVKAAMFDAKSTTLALSVDPMSDDLGIEWTMVPRAGTPLAIALSGNAARKSTAAARLKADGLASFTALKLALPDDFIPAANKLADLLTADAVAGAKPEEKDIAKAAVTAGLAIVRKGELDFGFATSKPRADGTVGMTAALKVAKGKDLEAVIKQVAAKAPANEVAFRFGIAEIGNLSLHSLQAKGDGAAHMKAVVGSDTVWFAIGDDLILVGTDEAVVKAAAAATPGPTPAVASDTAVAPIVNLLQKAEPNPAMAKALKETFGDAPAAGADKLMLSVETGDKLTVKFGIKGAVFTFFRLVGEAKQAK
jgi:hypothetical protein